MDQLIYASFSYTHCWYEVGMLKVPTKCRSLICMYVCMCVCMVIAYSKCKDQPGKVANPARGQLNRENEYFPVRVRAGEFGLARRVRQSRPALV